MLNHELDGHGPPLLLIHGFGISYPIWRELRAHLCDHFTLIMVELPGIGGSPPPSDGSSYRQAAVQGIEQLRLALGVDRWSVLSYSSGTRIAEEYLNCHASPVARAVFLCPARVRLATAAALRAAIRLDRQSPRLGTWALSGPRLRFLVQLLGFNMKKDRRSGEWVEMLNSQPIDTLKDTLRAMPRGGAGDFRLPAGIPALYVWGRNDLITATPRRPSQHDLIVHGGHSAPQTSAQEVAACILPFLMPEKRQPLPATDPFPRPPVN